MPESAPAGPVPTAVLLGPRDTVVAAAHRLGLDLVIVADPTQPRPPATDWPEIETAWTKDSGELVDRLRALDIAGPASCFGFGELGTAVSAAVNRELGWPGNPPEAPVAFKNKAALRALVADRAGAPVAHRLCGSGPEVAAAAAEIGYPCVVKPVDGSGSAGVRYLADPAQTERFLAEGELDGPHLVEEYLVGTEYSVEGMSVDGRHRVLAVTEKTTTGTPYFVETGHTMPVRLPARDAAAVTALVTATLDAAGHRYGPSHTEVMLTADGPRLIESHARPGGDRISDMLVLALGEDVFGQTMAAVLGLPLPPAADRPRVAGIRYVTFEDAVPVPATSTALVTSLPGVVEVHIGVPAGKVPGPIRKSGDRHGFVLAVADDRDALEARLDSAVRTLTARA
ncbi:ATP-grasp domain-containing protein [Streptomyces sp. NPDC059740]|uniref:ATP-grasp domain-containing protein n=1 Tax=Streptomyces sp. NPDC059740 TaxID=3346926 RepID=UPI00364CBC2D